MSVKGSTILFLPGLKTLILVTVTKPALKTWFPFLSAQFGRSVWYGYKLINKIKCFLGAIRSFDITHYIVIREVDEGKFRYWRKAKHALKQSFVSQLQSDSTGKSFRLFHWNLWNYRLNYEMVRIEWRTIPNFVLRQLSSTKLYVHAVL